MHGFWKQKIDFLTLDKIFVLDNSNIVLDKKYFVRADGRGISIFYEQPVNWETGEGFQDFFLLPLGFALDFLMVVAYLGKSQKISWV